MILSDTQVKEVLLRSNYLAAEDLENSEEYAKKNKVSLQSALIQQELLTSDLLGQALSEFFGVGYADLNTNIPDRDQIMRMPEEMARKFRLVLFSETPEKLIFTTDDPKAKMLPATLKTIAGQKPFEIRFSLGEDIDAILLQYRKALETRFGKILEKQKRVAPELLDEIFQDALTYNASDIHFEPQEKTVIIRFRVDGVLHEAGNLPKNFYENVLNRIKVKAHLRIDEHFSAQDGALRYEHDGHTSDMRISIVPTLDGEKVVIRLLSEYVRNFTLSDIGLSQQHQEHISRAAKKPFGMILVAGPTGSGKTTTLYSILKRINSPEINISTIEDPVEYKIPGVNHIQVNNETNLTFSKGLRSIVRQDPDVILVGEIRDEETAEIAVNAALTGHLLLSTFHANDAATAIPRLLDMAVEPFLLASTVELLFAQRLVRRICGKCRASHTISKDDVQKQFPGAENFLEHNTMNAYRGKGCVSCNHTGYKGRIAIFEFISVTPELKDLIYQNPSTQQIWKLARSQGSHSLFEDGLEKVKNGITTLEEVLRVANPPIFETK